MILIAIIFILPDVFLVTAKIISLRLPQTVFLSSSIFHCLKQSISSFFHTHFHTKKGILTLVRMGVKFEKQSRQVQTCIYILDHKKKENFFEKCLSVPPSARLTVRPCAKVMYTKTAKISTRTHEGLRSQSRMKFITTLLYRCYIK